MEAPVKKPKPPYDMWKAYARKRAEYVEIYVPSFTDVFQFPGMAAALGEDPVKKKKTFFGHVAHAPVPKFAAKMQRIAKRTDDIQDYCSAATTMAWFAYRLTSRWLPAIAAKIGSKAIPGLGWFMLGQDILNLATGVFAFASTPMMAKRLIHGCRSMRRRNVKARITNTKRLKDFRPGFGKMLEVAQASEDAFGIGIRLGAIFGCLAECFWAPVMYVLGETEDLRIRYPYQRPGTLEMKGHKVIQSVLELQPIHKYIPHMIPYSWLCACVGAAQGILGKSPHPNWNEAFHAVKDRKMIYEPPTNPDTRQALSEMGYDPDENVGWNGIDGTEMPTIGEVPDIYPGNIGEDYNDLRAAHADDWRTYALDCVVGDGTDSLIELCAYPDGEVKVTLADDFQELLNYVNAGFFPHLNLPTPCHQRGLDHLVAFRAVQDRHIWPREIEEILTVSWILVFHTLEATKIYSGRYPKPPLC